MSETKTPATAQALMALIANKSAQEIPEIEAIKNQTIKVYEACHPGENGQFFYERNLLFLFRTLNSKDEFRKCTPISVVACMSTMAQYKLSADPEDGDMYLIPRGGVLCISKQSGFYLNCLYQSKQITWNGQAKLVHQGDTFIVEDEIIQKHTEMNKSSIITHGYMRFIIDERGTKKDIVYSMEEIQAWRSRSSDKDGKNWNYKDGQPDPGFLKRKIALHAAKDPSWRRGNKPMNPEVFVEDDINADEYTEAEEVKDQQEDVKTDTSAPSQQAQASPAKPSFIRPNNRTNSNAEPKP